jgi:hypothetical protein
MTRELTLLLSLIAVGAGWLVVHVLLLARAARSDRLDKRIRLLAWLPPATPVVGWMAGARVLATLWALQAAVYVWLRSLV